MFNECKAAEKYNENNRTGEDAEEEEDVENDDVSTNDPESSVTENALESETEAALKAESNDIEGPLLVNKASQRMGRFILERSNIQG